MPLSGLLWCGGLAGERGSIGDEHAVAVGVEAVAFADGFLVGGEDEFAAGEGADEHEERGTGEVEIGEERAGLLEFVGGVDEDAGAAGTRLDGAGRLGLEDACDGGADGDAAFGGIEGGGGVGGNRVALLVHFVVLDVFGFHGEEGSSSDMKREESVGNFLENFGSEVEAGCGSGDGAGVGGVNGLVALVVGGIGIALEVGRERHVAVFFQVGEFVEIDDAFASGEDFDDFGGGSRDGNSCAGLEFASGFDEAFPAVRADLLEEENFDAGGIGEEAGFDDAGVVQDDEISFAKVAWEIGEEAMLDGSGGAVKDEHARGVAALGRTAGDEFGRKVVVVVADEAVHGGVRFFW
jgi:hypothetical protein